MAITVMSSANKSSILSILCSSSLLSLLYLTSMLFENANTFTLTPQNIIASYVRSSSQSDPILLDIYSLLNPTRYSNKELSTLRYSDTDQFNHMPLKSSITNKTSFPAYIPSHENSNYRNLETRFTSITNQQAEIPLDYGLIERHIEIIKEIMRIQDMTVSINFVTESVMRELNYQFLEKNSSSDILSFPSNPDKTIIEISDSSDHALHNLGDIFISPKYVQDKANKDLEQHELNLKTGKSSISKERGVNGALSDTFSIRSRIPFLLIHGFLHLLGYDHQDENQYLQMIEKEEEILKHFEDKRDEFRTSASGHYTIGIGTDLCKISRFDSLVKKYEPSLLRHICSDREKDSYNKNKLALIRRNYSSTDLIKWSSSYFAKRFAIKEAASKALGTGLRYLSKGGIHLSDVELMHQKSGKPEIEFKELALKVANKLGVANSYVSISDESDIAFAFVTLVGSNFHAKF